MSKKEILIITIIVIFAVGFWYSRELQQTFENTVHVVESYILGHKVLGIAAFIGLAALSAMLSPFSSVPLVPFAIAIWGKGLTFSYLLLGWVLGGTATYLIGRFAIYAVLGHLIPLDKIKKYQRQIPEGSQFWLVLLFRLAMPAEIPGYVLGSIHYNFNKYLWATFLAEIPGAIITIYASHAFVVKNPLGVAAWLIGGAILITIAFYIFRKKIT